MKKFTIVVLAVILLAFGLLLIAGDKAKNERPAFDGSDVFDGSLFEKETKEDRQ